MQSNHNSCLKELSYTLLNRVTIIKARLTNYHYLTSGLIRVNQSNFLDVMKIEQAEKTQRKVSRGRKTSPIKSRCRERGEETIIAFHTLWLLEKFIFGNYARGI